MSTVWPCFFNNMLSVFLIQTINYFSFQLINSKYLCVIYAYITSILSDFVVKNQCQSQAASSKGLHRPVGKGPIFLLVVMILLKTSSF